VTFFENALDGLQSEMTFFTGAPWPESDAKPEVRVMRDRVELGFVNTMGEEILRLRPIPLMEQ